ncbi:flagellar protein FliS [Alicyclobacillus contaminans]|uniref:flagellar export chaperone FliS n=1 Tax=Alicyclobacillus contaminans TaxID=392016 RepID=UPI00041C5E04|nr:flagellar export chaperone FliS [Alicyclobacillus contaminans]GMA51307.1 flagellar protein FliS [Alicyclobacillus contaminans]
MNSAYAAYRQTAIQTASPDKLIIMLYDGLILALERAKTAIATKDAAGAHQQLLKAQSILSEGLRAPLDMRYEVSKSLAALYDYWHRRLVEANIQKDAAPIDEVLVYVRDFRDTWVQVAEKARQEQAAAAPQGLSSGEALRHE